MSALLSLFVFGAGALGVWLFNRIALIPWRRAAALHWAERARRLYPVRQAAAANIILLPGFVALACVLVSPGHPWTALLLACAAWAGTLLGSYPFESLLYPWLTFRSWSYFVITGWLLRLLVWAPIVAVVLVMPTQLDWTAWAMTGCVVLLLMAFNFGAGLRLGRCLRLVHAPPERLRIIVEATATRMQVKVRRLWLMRGPTANAVAFPATRELVFTERLLALCSDEELAAICGHELGHLSESAAALAGRLSLSLALLPWLFLRPVMESKVSFAALLLVLSSLMIILLGRKLARRLEVRADGVAVTHSEPALYARALEKLYEANQMPVVMPGKRQIHPHLFDRLLAAGVTPAYPRPAPPNPWLYRVVLFLSMLVVMALIFATNFFAIR